MRTILVAAASIATLFVMAGTATAAPQTAATCSDLSYLNSALKVSKKNVTALKLSQKGSYRAALVPANAALWMAKHSAVPCDEGTDQYWLHRQYSIRYEVALVRYLEEMKRGDSDNADRYWSSLEFWGDELSDITYGW
jgi:hypothetical protein